MPLDCSGSNVGQDGSRSSSRPRSGGCSLGARCCCAAPTAPTAGQTLLVAIGRASGDLRVWWNTVESADGSESINRSSMRAETDMRIQVHSVSSRRSRLDVGRPFVDAERDGMVVLFKIERVVAGFLRVWTVRSKSSNSASGREPLCTFQVLAFSCSRSFPSSWNSPS